MHHYYPKIDLPRTPGCPFCMAFIYFPNGCRIYTGSLDNIRSETQDMPTSHGIVTYVNRGRKATIPIMFGKYACHPSSRAKFVSIRTLSKEEVKNSCMVTHQELLPYTTKRKRHFIIMYENGKTTVLARLRRLPHTHIRQLRKLGE